MQTINVNDLKDKLTKNEILLIDVRERHENQVASIAGARLIPLSQISLETLPSTDLPIVIHCASGKRSAEACTRLLQQNPKLTLYSLEGGINAWKSAGYPVESQKNVVISIERQTQIMAGLLSSIGLILGAFINGNFYLLSGFIGLGLLFSGITGWCGMAKLLSKMPWNHP